MSAEVINLRQVRKRKAKAEKEKSAEQNRLAFGRSKSEKDASRTAREKLKGHVDQHRIDHDDDPQPA
ncbi:uncharacterized protein DUF4169 [Roseibium hamelinense]|uniref:Uncharacterized protein DUF4169 n=1 Tax=Roseibium hamelinense TaxID=150831 RepID=A0A562T9A1_9HYPH|nr:DUF4169 family protein [Roseibium hamelinense]MTI45401.1 DUF4169 family protein [Roseibium hamelinense]TWI90227.1 uncharacterized protein DUF4169 [Roseibium hamelinense]